MTVREFLPLVDQNLDISPRYLPTLPESFDNVNDVECADSLDDRVKVVCYALPGSRTYLKIA
jgi:hypothetical protein